MSLATDLLDLADRAMFEDARTAQLRSCAAWVVAAAQAHNVVLPDPVDGHDLVVQLGKILRTWESAHEA